jgi:triacylglycerol lipase
MSRKRCFGHHRLNGTMVGFLLLAVTVKATGGQVDATMAVVEQAPRACVILLHGLGRSNRSMTKMARGLAGQGYLVINLDYPSTRADIGTLSRDALAPVVDRCRGQHPTMPIHFVTHSLGGILVRHYLQHHHLPPGSRVVMLSPPNQGSEIADRLKAFFLYRWIMGPAGRQLGTAADSVPNRLEPVAVPVGVITGDRSLEPWFSLQIPGPDDGKVSVARARLTEMTDFCVVHRSHAFIMDAPEVIDQSAFFLKHGKFKREGDYLEG